MLSLLMPGPVFSLFTVKQACARCIFKQDCYLIILLTSIDERPEDKI